MELTSPIQSLHKDQQPTISSDSLSFLITQRQASSRLLCLVFLIIKGPQNLALDQLLYALSQKVIQRSGCEGKRQAGDPGVQPAVQCRSEEDLSTLAVIMPALSQECATFRSAQIVTKGTAAF